jgi:hypothetical protein
VTYAFAFELFSLFLFIFTADRIHTLFVGAMCAAGTLNVNAWGYPTVVLKGANFLLAGTWLVLNHADNAAWDYPLIKKKYLLLLAVAPVILAEAIVQGGYFQSLKPDVITSCCGTLFSSESQGISAELVQLPRRSVEIVFYGSFGATFLLAGIFARTGRGGYLFGLAGLAGFFSAVAALISFQCLYIYELPTHHCPFCILQGEYGYVGYVLYAGLLTGAVTAAGVGVLMPFRKVESLKETLPRFQRKLALISAAAYGLYLALILYEMISSNLVMTGG